MSMPRNRRQFTLGVLMLWVLVSGVYCWNLKIVMIDQRENIDIIWKEVMG